MKTMNSMEDEKWTRKLSDYENLMVKCYEKGFMRIRYILVINSKAPMKTEDAESAIRYLFRKVPTLRLVIKDRNGDGLWFRNMEEEIIDFKMVEEVNYEAEKKAILHYKFDINNGPLWCVRIAPSSRACPMPEIKQEFAYQYDVLLCFYHCITDGYSNIAICDLFLKLLNDIVDQKEIDDQKQLGYHASDSQWQGLKMQLEQELSGDSAKYVETKVYYEEKAKAHNLLRAFFPFTEDSSTTESIHYDFDCEQTQKMLTVCRSHGVTMNSFMSTIVMSSVIEIVKNETPPEELLEEYVIPNGQLVNSRRYLKNDSKISLGCFAIPMSVITKVRSDILDTFWDHAKRFDADLKMRLNNFAPFEEEIYYKLTDAEGTVDPFLKENPQDINNLIFVTSNMGNLSKSFPGTGDNMQVTYINRVTLLKKIYTVHEMQSFRGRMLYALDYNPMYFSKETAQSWINTILNLINKKLNE